MFVAGGNDMIDVVCSDAFRQITNHVALQKSGLMHEMIDFYYRGPARVNVWQTFFQLEYPWTLLCAGIELKQPLWHLEDGRIRITA